MIRLLCLFIVVLANVCGDPSSTSFCLCALRNVLEDYALFTTDHLPPRYRGMFANDVGFYVVPQNWKPVNNATWTELAAMINAPGGVYTHISLDGKTPLNNGRLLNGLRLAHLADIITSYRSLISDVGRYHEFVINNRTQTCMNEQRSAISGSVVNNKWKQFFATRST